MSRQVDRMLEETRGTDSTTKSKPATAAPQEQANDLSQLLKEVGRRVETLERQRSRSGSQRVTQRHSKEVGAKLLEALETTLGLERETLMQLSNSLNKLEALYKQELSSKRRTATPVLWWRLALSSVLGAVLTTCLILGVLFML